MVILHDLAWESMAASGMMLYSCCRKGIVTNGAPILYKREVTPSRDKTFSSSQETQRERERGTTSCKRLPGIIWWVNTTRDYSCKFQFETCSAFSCLNSTGTGLFGASTPKVRKADEAHPNAIWMRCGSVVKWAHFFLPEISLFLKMPKHFRVLKTRQQLASRGN